MDDDPEGLERLAEFLQKQAEAANPERILASQKKGAEYMRNTMRGRSSPKRKGTMLESFTYEPDATNTETLFGWGRKGWYGRLKESGHRTRAGRKKKSSTHRVKAQPHLQPSLESHKEMLFQIMVSEFT